jgi:hypothetical protein
MTSGCMGTNLGAIQRGRAGPANDTWLAVCALTYDLPLVTLNVKDFEDFAEHEGQLDHPIVAMPVSRPFSWAS